MQATRLAAKKIFEVALKTFGDSIALGHLLRSISANQRNEFRASVNNAIEKARDTAQLIYTGTGRKSFAVPNEPIHRDLDPRLHLAQSTLSLSYFPGDDQIHADNVLHIPRPRLKELADLIDHFSDLIRLGYFEREALQESLSHPNLGHPALNARHSGIECINSSGGLLESHLALLMQFQLIGVASELVRPVANHPRSDCSSPVSSTAGFIKYVHATWPQKANVNHPGSHKTSCSQECPIPVYPAPNSISAAHTFASFCVHSREQILP